jgi:hypothetical protein
MGGGEGLPWVFVEWFSIPPTDALLLSANEHGVLLHLEGLCRRPDFIVAADRRMGPIELKQYGIPLISHHDWADVKLEEKPVWSSGMLAAYVAAQWGCAPIILAGTDCGSTYWHKRKTSPTAGKYPLREHLERWAVVKKLCPRADFRVAGGPLTALFASYHPFEECALREPKR